MNRNQGIVADQLFVGITRPTMIWGVTYSALLLNLVCTVEVFIVTKNLLWLLIFLPIHGIFYLVCAFEPRFFDLILLWGKTRAFPLIVGNARFWKANSYSPLLYDPPDFKGLRKRIPDYVVVSHAKRRSAKCRH